MKNELIVEFVEKQISQSVDEKINEYMPFLHRLSEEEIQMARKEEPFFNMRKISNEEFAKLMKGQ